MTGRSLVRLFRERIGTPAGLRETYFAAARPNALVSPTWASADDQVLGRFGAAGGLVGSVRDLYRFDRALMGDRLLSRASRDILWQADPSLGYMALGQWVFEAPLRGCAQPVRIVERRGGIRRFQVRNIILPDLDVVVILFVRDENFDFGEIWQGQGLSHDVLAAAACG